MFTKFRMAAKKFARIPGHRKFHTQRLERDILQMAPPSGAAVAPSPAALRRRSAVNGRRSSRARAGAQRELQHGLGVAYEFIVAFNERRGKIGLAADRGLLALDWVMLA